MSVGDIIQKAKRRPEIPGGVSCRLKKRLKIQAVAFPANRPKMLRAYFFLFLD
jgi:hypothetical protein